MLKTKTHDKKYMKNAALSLNTAYTSLTYWPIDGMTLVFSSTRFMAPKTRIKFGIDS